ncbi:ribokinase [Shouchella shacheensis]|uniref:ribokinase n=1 Tax=Shouchella shacheensis TaxID=1649580 RepID=UPI0009EC515C|nr:ribokinase [Shouchella shacheensis]
MDIVVIGSFMMDLVVRAPRAPENGETVIGSQFSRFPGGKGANQAVTVSRLGGKVTMLGKVGTDDFGKEAVATLQREEINIDHLLLDENHATGVGSVTLDENGDNRIVVVPGANYAYSTNDLRTVKSIIAKAKVLIVQLEMDVTMIEDALVWAAEHGVSTILNPAPARELSDNILENVTFLTPNETEAELLTGVKIRCLESALIAGKMLVDRGIQHVIVTLADKGALIVNRQGFKSVPGFPVQPVDSVAAGDAFNGALATGLVRGKSLEEAVVYANAVGALTVTREGAIPSIPYHQEVEPFIRGHKEAQI